MDKPKSTKLGGDEPQSQETQQPKGPPPQQLHDPDSPDNLLRGGRPLSAKDLMGSPPDVDDPELKAAEERIKREQEAIREAEAATPSLPLQPSQGAAYRPPATTELPQGQEPSMFDRRTLPGVRRSLELYTPPEVEITDEDMLRMLECIIHNKHYSEKFKKGPVEVLFRVKSAKEVDFQRANISKMAAAGEFGLMSDFHAAVARYNQLFQVVSYNGREVAPVRIPPRPWKKEDINLEEQYWASWLSDITESAGYIVHGMMIQFEDKVYRMQQRMLEPDFTMPAAPSSSARG
jgi:hypothetical protein